MSSRRFPEDLTPNALTRARERRVAKGLPLLDLTTANPARAGLAWDDEVLADLLRVTGIANHRPEAAGLPEARDAVVAHCAETGLRVERDDVFLTASTSEAYAFLFKCLCEPGDEVLVPTPSYPLLSVLAQLEGVELVSYPLRLDPEAGRWSLDLDALASRLSERSRIVLVVHPNNPTASCLSDQEARGLARLCRERNLLLLSDEVFREFAWDGSVVPSLLDACREEEALGCVLGGLSKTAGLPQLKLSWVLSTGPEKELSRLRERLEWVADAQLNLSTPVQLALPKLLPASAEWRERCRERIAKDLDILRSRVNAMPELQLLPGEAGWHAILEMSVDDEELCTKLMVEHGLVLQPGRLFDFTSRSVVVVSTIVEPSTLAEGLDVVTDILRTNP
ncbi:MAG: pyridoxal phosphate-dependent aminotransferase [Acidobacteriota bacterium]